MKLADTIVSIIIAAAVLLSAYGVGLLIREVRTGGEQPPSQSVAEVNKVTAEPRLAALTDNSPGRTTNVPEQATELEESIQTASEPNSLSQKDERPSKGGAGKRADGRRGDSTLRALSPREREQMRQRWKSTSDEQRQSRKTRTPSRSGEDRPPRRNDTTQESTEAERNAGETDSEPDRNNQG